MLLRVLKLSPSLEVSVFQKMFMRSSKKTDFHFNDVGEQKAQNTLLHAVDVVIDETHQRTVKTQVKSKTPLFATIAAVLILSAGGFAYYQHSPMEISKGGPSKYPINSRS